MTSPKNMEPRLQNLLQHFQHRQGIYGPQAPISPEEMAKAFEQMLRALLEQASQGFAVSPASNAWMHTLSRFVYSVLQHVRGEQQTENTEALLMAVLNALEAFATAQALIGRSEPFGKT